MINGLQIVMYFPLMNVQAPSNLGVIQKVTMLILTFEIVPGDLYQKYIWDWDEKEDLVTKQQAVGLESRIIMLSLGMPFYVLAIAIVLLLVAVVMDIIASK